MAAISDKYTSIHTTYTDANLMPGNMALVLESILTWTYKWLCLRIYTKPKHTLCSGKLVSNGLMEYKHTGCYHRQADMAAVHVGLARLLWILHMCSTAYLTKHTFRSFRFGPVR